MALSPVMTDLTLALALALDMIDLKRNATVTIHDRQHLMTLSPTMIDLALLMAQSRNEHVNVADI